MTAICRQGLGDPPIFPALVVLNQEWFASLPPRLHNAKAIWWFLETFLVIALQGQVPRASRGLKPRDSADYHAMLRTKCQPCRKWASLTQRIFLVTYLWSGRWSMECVQEDEMFAPKWWTLGFCFSQVIPLGINACSDFRNASVTHQEDLEQWIRLEEVSRVLNKNYITHPNGTHSGNKNDLSSCDLTTVHTANITS